MKVRALNTYKELNISDNELNRIPVAGEEFEVSEERAKTLLGDNSYKVAFVELVEEAKEEKAEPKKEQKKPAKKK